MTAQSLQAIAIEPTRRSTALVPTLAAHGAARSAQRKRGLRGMRSLMRALIPFLALLAACTPQTPTVAGRASVIDGDTLEIHGQRIRLWGVDAPEGRQSCDGADGAAYACGRLAASRLDAHLRDKVVSCFEEDIDRYGRIVARCDAGGEDVGAWLIRQGHAVRYARFAGAAYIAEEDAARQARVGVWAGAFTNPEDWRRKRRGGR